MNIIKQIRLKSQTLINFLPDIFIFIGLGLLGYGLWLYVQWLGYVVIGALLFMMGLLMGINE